MKILILIILIIIILYSIFKNKKEHFTFPKLIINNVFDGKKVIIGADKHIPPKGYNTNGNL